MKSDFNVMKKWRWFLNHHLLVCVHHVTSKWIVLPVLTAVVVTSHFTSKGNHADWRYLGDIEHVGVQNYNITDPAALKVITSRLTRCNTSLTWNESCSSLLHKCSEKVLFSERICYRNLLKERWGHHSLFFVDMSIMILVTEWYSLLIPDVLKWI